VYHRCGRVLPAGAKVRDFPELSGLDAALELPPNIGIRGISHAASERRFKYRAAVLYSRSLEDMIARPGHGPLRLHLPVLHPILPVFARLSDYTVRLMPKPGGQLAVPL
jgi:hypothetical protein